MQTSLLSRVPCHYGILAFGSIQDRSDNGGSSFLLGRSFLLEQSVKMFGACGVVSCCWETDL